MAAVLGPNIVVAAPTSDSLKEDYAAIDRRFDEAGGDFDTTLAAVREWDDLRRRLRTWQALVRLRFRQDTRDESARKARELADALEPEIIARDVAIKRRLLGHRVRDRLQTTFGAQAFRLWEADLRTYAPQIDAALVEESSLEAEYTKLFGGINVEFGGRTITLAEARGFLNHRDREMRHNAERARWSAIGRRCEELDRIFGGLVAVRDRIGKLLGGTDFVSTGYARMQRVDYDASDVERWRNSVVADIVPLACEFVERCSARLGHPIAWWDESVLVDADANPIGDGASLVARLPDVLGEVDSRLGTFAAFMRDRQYLDVFAREGKGPGGFCTSFPTEGHPYIFASFNGTKDDVKVLVHEMGHAFQSYLSRDLALEDYLTPTSESAEIHSMSLELLAWPALERYFGEHADAFRAGHLASRLLFLPYGCAIDHFQHLVYARPNASAAERRDMWLQMERRYLPWRRYGDLEYPAAGNFWQAQLHVYSYPFYYIDYTLAECCALQFWAQAQRNRTEAVERYVALCARGGSASFRELVSGAGLRSPFDGSALQFVAREAHDFLEAAELL